jgi:hypothetical protein
LSYSNRTPPRDALFASPAGAFLSTIIGIIFMYLGLPFLKWLIATISGQTFVTGWVWPNDGTPRAGQPVSYWQLQTGTAWNDMGVFVFGLSALIDAIVTVICIRAADRRVVCEIAMFVAMGATALSTVVNLLACIKLFSVGITPIMSLLAVAIGGYILIEQWPRVIRPKKRLLSQR